MAYYNPYNWIANYHLNTAMKNWVLVTAHLSALQPWNKDLI